MLAASDLRLHCNCTGDNEDRRLIGHGVGDPGAEVRGHTYDLRMLPWNTRLPECHSILHETWECALVSETPSERSYCGQQLQLIDALAIAQRPRHKCR